MANLDENIKNHKRIFGTIIFLIVFFAILFAVYNKGLKNPVKEPEKFEVPKVLESAFSRWHKGESDELFATFKLVNHTEQNIEKITIGCVSFMVNGKELQNYQRSVNVFIYPSEARVLNRVYMGVLDELAQRVNCRVESWE
ncbi:MAG: hypothetical protein LBU73_06380 [Helicobacteraceae bacterium]|jgi:hypothetical protein|nr:hypothetical protein [Helicobacteraceae bacterium]